MILTQRIAKITSSHRARMILLQGVLLSLVLPSCATAQESDPSPDQTAKPEVAVVKVVRGNMAQSLNITAEFQPCQVVDVHAKVSGYIKQILVDVGDQVRLGQTIAILEIPEIDADVAEAKAALLAAQQQAKSSQALFDDAHLMYSRLSKAAQSDPHLIAQQELDTSQSMEQSKQADLDAAQEKVEEAKAQLARLQAQVDYATVTAPFTGVVTKRYLHTGALVQGGTTGTSSIPLVTVAELDHLRLVFPVPEAAVPSISLGKAVQVQMISTGQEFQAKISRFSHNVDLDTRTMHTEADIDNADGKLFPGTYATVNLPEANVTNALEIPVQALIPGEHPCVLVLNDKSEVTEQPVKVELETANKAEIVSGLKENDLVLVGSHSNVQVGQAATPKIVDPNSL